MAVKRAVRRLVRRPDGTVGVSYVDLDTMEVINDLTGYQIISAAQAVAELDEKITPKDAKGSTKKLSDLLAEFRGGTIEDSFNDLYSILNGELPEGMTIEEL